MRLGCLRKLWPEKVRTSSTFDVYVSSTHCLQNAIDAIDDGWKHRKALLDDVDLHFGGTLSYRAKLSWRRRQRAREHTDRDH